MDIMALIYIFEAILMIVIVLAMKKKLMKGIFGKRYKDYIEIDTGKQGYVILSKNLDSCKIDGITKSINWRNIHYNILYFYNNLAENVKVDYDNDKAKFYMNSNEFNTLINNNVYEKLMISKSEKLIFIILCATILCFVGIAYIIYQGMNEKSMLESIYYALPKPEVVTVIGK